MHIRTAFILPILPIFLAAGVFLGVFGASVTVSKPAEAAWDCGGYGGYGECVSGLAPTAWAACEAVQLRWSPAKDLLGIHRHATREDTYWCELDSLVGDTTTTVECPTGYLINLGRSDGCQAPTDDWEEWGCPMDVGSPMVGNPCNPANGNKYETAVDYQSAGPDVLEFKRYYNSTNWLKTSFGYGWRHTYHRRLQFPEAGKVWVFQPYGVFLEFVDPNGTGDWVPSGVSGRDAVIKLVPVTSGWEVTLGDDTTETYNGAGRLLSIGKKHGYTQTMGYDGNGWLTSVADSHGRNLTFTYITTMDGDPRLSTMTDPDGRIYKYRYQGISSDNPDPAVLRKVIYPEDGATVLPAGDGVKLLTHLDGATTATDDSDSNHTLTFVGAAQIDTAQSRFGGASALFDDTTSSYISIPDSEDWNFGAGEFTAEAWVRFSSIASYSALIAHFDGTTDQESWLVDWATGLGGVIRFLYSPDGTDANRVTLAASWVPTVGAWHHIAVDRDSGSNLRIYVDGMVLLNTVVTTAFHNSTHLLRIGVLHDGWIDEVGITKGVAQYGGDMGPSVTYLYEDSQFLYGLTGIVDETGTRLATFSYGGMGRTLLSEHAGGADRYEFRNYPHVISYSTTGGKYFVPGVYRTGVVSWSPNVPIITNPLGKEFQYFYSTRASDEKMYQINRLVDGSQSTFSDGTEYGVSELSAYFTYDSNGFLASSTDWDGVQTTFVNNARGLQTSRTEAFGTPEERTTTTTWHPDFRVPTQIVEPGRTTDLTYYPGGLLHTLTVIDATTHTVPYATAGQARAWTFTYDAQGLIATVDGPRTDVTDVTGFAWDPVTGDLTSVTNAAGHVTQMTAHDPSGRPLTVIDPNGVRTDLTYDARGRLMTITDDVLGTPRLTTIGRDRAGNILSTTLPDGSTLAYEFDGARRLTAVENVDGERIEYTYDAMGNITGETVRAAETAPGVPGTIVRTATTTFDSLGRLLKSIGAHVGEETTYAYDTSGNVVSVTDALGNVTGIGLDALYRVIDVTDPVIDGVSGVAGFGHDPADNLATVTDQRGLATDYVHNGFGEVIQRDSPDTGITVLTYDAAGNVASATDGRGVVTDLSYDALGRPTAMRFPATPAEDLTYAYDDATPGHNGIGRPATITDRSGSTAWRYDSRGNITHETRVIGTQTYVTQYAWDAGGLLVERIYPSGRIVTYTRDALGRVTAVTTKADEFAAPVTLASGIGYEPFGPVNALTYGNGVTANYGYDLNGRLTTIDTFSGATPILDLDYDYDLAGNITAITDVGGGARGRNYGYDALYRLTSAQELAPGGGSVALQTDYGLDKVGNRLTRTVGGAVETYAYDTGSNRLQSVTSGGVTRSFTYGGSGNVTLDDLAGSALTLTYDSADRLVQVSAGAVVLADYAYAASGQRAVKDVAGVVTHYLHDPGGALYAETDGAGAVLREYVTLGGVTLAVVDAGGAIAWVHADHLATAQVLTDGSGAMLWDASYRPFGAVTPAGPASFDQRFPGQTADAESGYHDNWQRSYDAQLGRYLQSDPIGLAGGPNTYAYVGGNPVMLADPTGEILPLIAVAVYQLAVVGGTSYGIGLGLGRLYLIIRRYLRQGCIDREQTLALGESLAWAAGGYVGGAAILGGYRAYKGFRNARRAADAPKPTPHKNSLDYVGDTHVYSIRGPDGTTFKIGESARGVRVRDGASIRAEQQARRLRKETGEFYRSQIRRTFPDKRSAREHETALIERFRRRFGQDTLPGNLTNR